MIKMRSELLLLLPLVAAFIGFPLLSVPVFFVRSTIIIIMWVILAESWNILGGYTGYVSFGHAAFFGLGAYFVAILLRDVGLSPFITAPIAGLFSSGVAFVFGYAVLRLKGNYFSIATLSLNYVLQLVISNIYWMTGGGNGLSLVTLPFDIKTSLSIFYWYFLAVALITIYVIYRINRSTFGWAMLAIRENEDAAKSLGIDVNVIKRRAYAISAFFTGLAGGAYAYFISYIDPPSAFAIAFNLNVVLMSIFGGLGTILGPLIGAISLTSVLLLVTYTFMSSLNLAIYGVILIIVVMFAPDGIVSILSRRKKV
jgi:branched-chain amino acid transport system permease protein